MASIRRTLSPIPRPGSSMNGEACSVASPLSRPSLSTQSQSQSSGLLYAPVNSLDSQAGILRVYSPRSSRSVEKLKSKVYVWRKALFHFFICFIVGFLIGFAPLTSTNLSMNFISKYQAFQYDFEMISTVGKIQPQSQDRNIVSVSLEGEEMKNKINLTQAQVPIYQVSNEKVDNQPQPIFGELDPKKLLIIVTPTSVRPIQSYYLNRLAQVLKLIPPPLLWIVVDMYSQSAETADILRSTGIVYRHIVCSKNITDTRGQRVHQRNLALSHIETHHLDGIVYFADENNIYSVGLFDKMREIRRFGTWLVAKSSWGASGSILEGPICNGSLVIGWHINDVNMQNRRFHAQISGFAFNSTILWDPERWHRRTFEPVRLLDTIRDAFQVSDFIEQIVEDESQMEGLRQDCSKVMVWNVHFEPLSALSDESF